MYRSRSRFRLSHHQTCKQCLTMFGIGNIGDSEPFFQWKAFYIPAFSDNTSTIPKSKHRQASHTCLVTLVYWQPSVPMQMPPTWCSGRGRGHHRALVLVVYQLPRPRPRPRVLHAAVRAAVPGALQARHAVQARGVAAAAGEGERHHVVGGEDDQPLVHDQEVQHRHHGAEHLHIKVSKLPE